MSNSSYPPKPAQQAEPEEPLTLQSIHDCTLFSKCYPSVDTLNKLLNISMKPFAAVQGMHWGSFFIRDGIPRYLGSKILQVPVKGVIKRTSIGNNGQYRAYVSLDWGHAIADLEVNLQDIIQSKMKGHEILWTNTVMGMEAESMEVESMEAETFPELSVQYGSKNEVYKDLFEIIGESGRAFPILNHTDMPLNAEVGLLLQLGVWVNGDKGGLQWRVKAVYGGGAKVPLLQNIST